MSTSDFKFRVVGSGGVGKSALTVRFLHPDTFLTGYDPTIEDAYRHTIDVDGSAYHLDILDTAGQENYIVMRDSQLRDGMAFILVYSIDSRESFEEVKTIYERIKKVKKEKDHIPMILVGNKCDLGDLRKVPAADGRALAKKWSGDKEEGQLGYVPHIESSAKSPENVEEVFIELVKSTDRWVRTQESREDAGAKKGAGKKKGWCSIL